MVPISCFAMVTTYNGHLKRKDQRGIASNSPACNTCAGHEARWDRLQPAQPSPASLFAT
ncbi:unnamed protein product [Dovyalis caffra]|uniref:Uncharacterized protein n=1 Tax=Dovyalis caffra TaxID=77055 RepID=A0AAV1REA8_9ROSI|nr:unnamed protein product [Dovyalis caffra]